MYPLYQSLQQASLVTLSSHLGGTHVVNRSCSSSCLWLETAAGGRTSGLLVFVGLQRCRGKR